MVPLPRERGRIPRCSRPRPDILPCEAGEGDRPSGPAEGRPVGRLRRWRGRGRRVRAFPAKSGSLCFSDGEAIRQEDGAGRTGSTAKSVRRRGRPPAGNPPGRVHLAQILRVPARPMHHIDRRRNPRPCAKCPPAERFRFGRKCSRWRLPRCKLQCVSVSRGAVDQVLQRLAALKGVHLVEHRADQVVGVRRRRRVRRDEHLGMRPQRARFRQRLDL